MFIIPLLTGFAAVAAASPYPRSAEHAPIVNTSHGKVLGTTSDYRDGVNVFKGIPFAKGPTGTLRWKAPQPTGWTGTLNATVFGDQCIQSTSGSGIFNTDTVAVSEDCLNLNIWTPANATAGDNLPVYVWIFGGRFELGSNAVPTYDGSALALKDIIVVTVNYRMGAFGFLAHPDLSVESGHNSSGNYGVLDQQASLRWVKDEIANFGGNPNQITVGGQSAGSASALDMMYSPLSSDLIAGVIAESGARGVHDPQTGIAATSHRSKRAAEEFGVSFLDTMNVTSIDQLRNVSADALFAEQFLSDTIFEGSVFENVTEWESEPPQWRPVIDGYVLPYTYGETLRKGAHKDIPILTGNNKDESGASPAPGYTVETYTEQFTTMFGNFSDRFFDLYPASTPNASVNSFYRDLERVGTWKWAQDYNAGGANSDVYTYYWNHSPPNQTQGAYHGSELYYAFNSIPYADDDTDWQTEDFTIAGVLSEYWANFIKTGNPNGGNLTYFPSSKLESTTMWLGDSWGTGYISSTGNSSIKFLEDWFALQVEW